ncbi:3-hydroxyacyl-CoA dehydrogenase family protein [Actinokineospora bangkokensis]|uniref:3-hydroxybutyryl-CoA dehydrogenase n=1 Tax=Actinokineospora bangkokensis TaxID=1193682 RepID=A0A1Q9LM14_9PSEU|nr:3-hydroxyacyl-CoA dehydrogenase NAD-binding domain-containing protein [Actinokineospora bangkokensis]OLR93049.1 3-hydroxybutyryl-CoA dehydrogenase [Actinokineospora bangkokensis]
MIGVVGAGTIGTGVAQDLAQAGHDVVLVDISADALATAREEIGRAVRFQRVVAPHLPTHDVDEVLGRITTTTDLGALATASLVVENVSERWEAKQAVHRELDRVCGPDAIFVVNTSCFPITDVAAVTGRPQQVVGVHFMNPVPLKPVVELIPGWHTTQATIDAVKAVLATAGKRAIQVKDSPGFVSNRVLMLTVNEAVFAYSEGIASARDIDDLFRGCFGHEMGPLATADLIGLDTILHSLEVLHERFADSKYRPCPLLRTMVSAGLLGRKSGQGFHDYGSAPRATPTPRPVQTQGA